MAYNKSLVVVGCGQKLGDVEGFGNRLIVDYKLRRYAVQGLYPLTRYMWHAWPNKNRTPDPRIYLK
jgi:hypothetical protein